MNAFSGLTNSPPATRPEVSVVIPVFGKRGRAAPLSPVITAWLAQDVASEVIIAHTGTPPPVARTPCVTTIEAKIAEPGPGLLRNHGVRVARGRTLYLSDADVAPIGTDFLRRALRIAGDGALAQPWMYRLLTGTLPGSTAAVRPPVPAGQHCFVTATGQGQLNPSQLNPVAGDSVAWRTRPGTGGPPRRIPYAAVPTGVPQGCSGRRPLRAALHWGGLLIAPSVFHSVGGYCPLYRGWGCEDDDLLVKVAAVGGLAYAADTVRSLVCLHVEHDYQHTGTPEHHANRRLLHDRRNRGPHAMITVDRNAASSDSP